MNTTTVKIPPEEVNNNSLGLKPEVMSNYTQSFWRLFCLSFAKKMTKSSLRSAFLWGLINHGEHRENTPESFGRAQRE
jgi:hypothetical protein